MNTPRLIQAAVLLFCFTFLIAGCKAKPPGKWETWVVTRAKKQLLGDDKKVKNPLATTPQNIVFGQESFSHYCAACHGLDGQNTGVPFADRMSPPVPLLTSAGVQAYTDGQLEWIITNGLWPSGMPASKEILTDEEIWATVLYIRHLPPAGSLGEPAMYSGDESSR